jgi:hypothetical protein
VHSKFRHPDDSLLGLDDRCLGSDAPSLDMEIACDGPDDRATSTERGSI